MKQVTKSLVIVGAMLAAGSSTADMLNMDEFKGFAGVDYLQAWMPGRGSITTFSDATRTDTINAKSVFRSSYPGATVYVGGKFGDCVGLELGWDSSLSSKKKTATSPSSSPFTYTYTSKVRREGFHADLIGYAPMSDCMNLFASVGIGSVKAKISNQVLTASASTAATAAVNQAALNASTPLPLSSKRKSVLRLGAGASYMLTEMVGLRAKLGWEGTDNLRLKYNNGSTAKAFKSSTTLAAGLFVTW
ncbi:MAG TPA: outer membrane beta-barrel protein [Gammaproteobacteria bacterium]|nr:outer membrane beta-barrel protein [Gammaproteobacteria bacterium]